MKRTLFVRVGVAIAMAAFALTARPSAYVLFGWKWGSLQVPYYINPANSDVSEGAAVTAIQSAADAWRLQTSSPFSLYYGGYTSGNTAVNNGKNEVFFRSDSNGAAIATTYFWSSGSSALDADTIMWDGVYTFFTGSSGCNGGFYIEDVMTHEFGHALGLNHSGVGTATMVSGSDYCATWKRSLDPDDVQGIEALYPPGSSTPPPANTAPTTTILSPASGTTFSSGSTETLSGSAVDTQDGNISSKIVWSSNIQGTLGTGASITVALQAGTHAITAKVTDTAGASGQASTSLIVSSPQAPASSSGFTLSGTARKQKGLQKADLRWTGASASTVDVYRNGAKRTTTSNSGSYTDNIDLKGSGSYKYSVCDAGTTNCSNTITLTF